MRLYEAVPDGEPRGAVIVIQEAFGVNPHIEDVTRRFADGRLPRGRARHVPPHRRRRRRLRRLRPGDRALHRHRRATTRSSPTSTPTLDYLHGVGFADAPDRHRRLLLRRAGLVPRRGAARARRRRRLLRRRHRDRPVPAVPGARRPRAAPCRRRGSGLFGDLDESIPVEDVEQLRDGAHRARRSTPMSCGTPTPSTASTATRGRRTTPTPRPTRGSARSTGSTAISAAS